MSHGVDDGEGFTDANHSVGLLSSYNHSLVACIDASVCVVCRSSRPSLIVEGASITAGGKIQHTCTISWYAVTRGSATSPMVGVEVICDCAWVDANMTLIGKRIGGLDVNVVGNLDVLADGKFFLVDADTWSMGRTET